MSLANRYALAVDTQRWEMFDEIFTEDVVAYYGTTAIWKDLASFKQDFAAYHALFDSTKHTMSNMCRIIWGGENPHMNETIPGVSFELSVTSLQQAADEGTLGFLRVHQT